MPTESVEAVAEDIASATWKSLVSEASKPAEAEEENMSDISAEVSSFEEPTNTFPANQEAAGSQFMNETLSMSPEESRENIQDTPEEGEDDVGSRSQDKEAAVNARHDSPPPSEIIKDLTDGDDSEPEIISAIKAKPPSPHPAEIIQDLNGDNSETENIMAPPKPGLGRKGSTDATMLYNFMDSQNYPPIDSISENELPTQEQDAFAGAVMNALQARLPSNPAEDDIEQPSKQKEKEDGRTKYVEKDRNEDSNRPLILPPKPKAKKTTPAQVEEQEFLSDVDSSPDLLKLLEEDDLRKEKEKMEKQQAEEEAEFLKVPTENAQIQEELFDGDAVESAEEQLDEVTEVRSKADNVEIAIVQKQSEKDEEIAKLRAQLEKEKQDIIFDLEEKLRQKGVENAELRNVNVEQNRAIEAFRDLEESTEKANQVQVYITPSSSDEDASTVKEERFSRPKKRKITKPKPMRQPKKRKVTSRLPKQKQSAKVIEISPSTDSEQSGGDDSILENNHSDEESISDELPREVWLPKVRERLARLQSKVVDRKKRRRDSSTESGAIRKRKRAPSTEKVDIADSDSEHSPKKRQKVNESKQPDSFRFVEVDNPYASALMTPEIIMMSTDKDLGEDMFASNWVILYCTAERRKLSKVKDVDIFELLGKTEKDTIKSFHKRMHKREKNLLAAFKIQKQVEKSSVALHLSDQLDANKSLFQHELDFHYILSKRRVVFDKLIPCDLDFDFDTITEPTVCSKIWKYIENYQETKLAFKSEKKKVKSDRKIKRPSGRRVWSEENEINLVQAFNDSADRKNKWAYISKNSFPGKFKNTQIKDKWRNLEKFGRVRKSGDKWIYADSTYGSMYNLEKS